ncbi:hypothetical protein [Enterovibrio coralii]|uniref:hypothetical protein n=1 Tax=Enterovibrio coralii TaxID=294935 RepID=UPI001E60F078|nr:hypothetical protein [Enterovibrio coralii]
MFLWRLGQYRQSIVPAYRFAARRYLFNPLGCNTQLYNQPIPEPDINHLAKEENLPVALKRRSIAGDRKAIFYPHAFTVFVDGILQTADQLQICNLSDAVADWAHSPVDLISVDPELGRISLPASMPEPDVVSVTYHYGFSADIGGGSYSRSGGFIASNMAVQSIGEGDSIQPALDLISTGGVAEIGVSHLFQEALSVAVDSDQTLSLRAADGHRAFIDLDGNAMTLVGGDESEIVLDGLVISGGQIVVPNDGSNALRRLVLRNITLVPGLSLDIHGDPVSPNSPSLVVEMPNVTVEIERSILGAIRTVEGASVTLKDSIIDAASNTGTAFSSLDGSQHGGVLTLCESTVIGKVGARSFPLISNSILDASLAVGDGWTAPVWALQRQTGCARFSYIPPLSRVPRQHRCQPQFAASKAIEAAEARNPALSDAERSHIARGVRARVVPAFTSIRYNDAAYGQLLLSAPVELLRGADSGSEMGVYHHLYHPQRHDALLFRLNEFLPIGLDAGLIYVT